MRSCRWVVYMFHCTSRYGMVYMLYFKAKCDGQPPTIHFAEAINSRSGCRKQGYARLKRGNASMSVQVCLFAIHLVLHEILCLYMFCAPELQVQNKNNTIAFFSHPQHHQFQLSSFCPPCANTLASPSSPSHPSSLHSLQPSSYKPLSSLPS